MEKELIFSVTKDDFEITTFSGTGAGGQHRNKHQNCVRMKHKETGIITTGQTQKSLNQNRKEAFLNMTNHPKFKVWLNNKIYERSLQAEKDRQAIERAVENGLREENLKIEYF